MNFSLKKALLMGASVALMLLSNFVDGKICEDDLREIVKEEIANEETKRRRNNGCDRRV